MASSNDLEKFRQEWKEELQRDNDAGSGLQETNDTNVKTGSAASSQTRSSPTENASKSRSRSGKNQRLDLPLPVPVSNPRIERQFVSDLDDSSNDTEAAPESSNSSRQNKYCSDHSQTSMSADSNEYYPFKILTQFLNEAPQKKTKPMSKKFPRSQEMSFAKRNYFLNLNSKPQENIHCRKRKDKDYVENKTYMDNSSAKKRILDLFIEDLDEINEIPFFDTTVPREVAIKIFQHFDMKTLCNCSLVSKSWRSLAEDELLWCNICHKLGYDVDLNVSDVGNWKNKVRSYIEQEQLLHSNWKERMGKPYCLNFARGGVLCAVYSVGSYIFAGYTSCNIRSWDAQTGDICTYNASNTALVLDETEEELGCIRNEVKHLSATPFITAASFKHGFVDVWRSEMGTDPIHTFSFRSPNISSLCTVDVNQSISLVAASQDTQLQVALIDAEEGQCLHNTEIRAKIWQTYWLNSGQLREKPRLIISCSNTVHQMAPNLDTDSWSPSHSLEDDQPSLTEIHNIILAPISCVALREKSDQIAVGYSTSIGASTQVKVNIYDIQSNKHTETLLGHTWFISCMHLPQSIPNELVSGSGDRKVRLFDLRAGSYPTLTFAGHSAKVTCVQMDEWKVVSADEAGFVCVWDQRKARKLWDVHSRHPVQYCHFDDRLLIIGNVPYQKFPVDSEFESVSSRRYRGTVQVYDFLANQQTQGIPDICLSSYNEPEAYDYNISLAVPYDNL